MGGGACVGLQCLYMPVSLLHIVNMYVLQKQTQTQTQRHIHRDTEWRRSIRSAILQNIFIFSQLALHRWVTYRHTDIGHIQSQSHRHTHRHRHTANIERDGYTDTKTEDREKERQTHRHIQERDTHTS